MKIIDCPLEGLKIIELPVYRDARGFFLEKFHVKRFAEAGLPHIFVQDNHSRSLPGVLRGVHYQFAPAQGKLVSVACGRIWDVAVDVRPNSATYGQHFSLEMNSDEGKIFWIPPGFAHGFCVLGDHAAEVTYKVTSVYNAAGEGGIRFDDPELNIPWPINNPLVSGRDKNMQDFKTYKTAPVLWP